MLIITGVDSKPTTRRTARKGTAMVHRLLARMRTTPARRSTFQPVSDRSAVPLMPTVVIAAAITVSVGATGAVLPLVL